MHPILLDDAGNDNDERARGTANLHFRAAEERYYQTRHDSGDYALFRCHARRDTEGDGQRQSYDAHDDTRQQILDKRLAVIILDG